MKTTIVLCVFVAGLLASSLPTNFDARKQWNHCNFTIMNQGDCGSCSDFCSTEAFADRLCITGEAPSGTVISPEPVLECTKQNSCQGGETSFVWDYFISHGGTTCTERCAKGCAPYDSRNGKTPKCNQGKCDDGSKWPVTYYGGSFQELGPPGSASIELYQTELYNNGPIMALFQVYDNFYSFFDNNPTGIYKEASGSRLGGHCAKLLGWGHEDSTDYWLLANSWGPNFADNGYFKMKRGIDLCQIESWITEGFTKKQAADMDLVQGVPANSSGPIVGGWTRSDTRSQVLEEAISFGLSAIAKKLDREFTFSSVVNVETQVVAGLNVQVEVKTEEGHTVSMKLHRDLEFQYHLTDFQFVL